VLDHVFRTYPPFVPEPRRDNPPLEELESAEACYLAGLHVDQYRDPLVKPSAYWEAGLAIDPAHAPCLTAIGRYQVGLQNYGEAERYLERAVESLTRHNPNPRDTEAFYLLGLSFLGQGRYGDAREAFGKAAWSRQQTLPACLRMAELDCVQSDLVSAETTLRSLIRTHGENQRAMCLLSAVLRRRGESGEALSIIERVLETDPLDYLALNERRILGGACFLETLLTDREQIALDIAFDYASAGMHDDGLDILRLAESLAGEPSSTLLYAEGYMAKRIGDTSLMQGCYRRAAGAKRGGCFPFREGEARALRDAISENPLDGRARLELGNLLYGKRGGYAEAVSSWEAAAKLLPYSAEVFRNLALSRYNRDNTDPAAMVFIEKALTLEPENLQLLYERNVLAELQGLPIERRLEIWKSLPVEPELWDDLYLQGVRLFNQADLWIEALRLLESHTFIPCEGGEHAVANEYLFAHHALGLTALKEGREEKALSHFRSTMNLPKNLGGGVWHEVMFTPYLCGEGICLERLGRNGEAAESFDSVAGFPVNYFTEMYLPSFRYYRGLALTRLGKVDEGRGEFEALYAKAAAGLGRKDPGYFAATPFFHSYLENPRTAREKHFFMLEGLALLGLGERDAARQRFEAVLKLDPANAMAALLRDTGT
jgi:tetratricopeptide (TPR) repeat protein